MISKPKPPIGLKAPYASRWLRLAGALIDGLILFPLCLTFSLLPDWNALAHDWSIDVVTLKRMAGMAFGITLFLLIQGWLIYTRGQTVGKVICGTVVVTKDGQQVSGNRYLFGRIVPFWCLGLLWFISVPLDLVLVPLASLADALAIFRREKNRLVDDIAGTRVIMQADLKTFGEEEGACTSASSDCRNSTVKEQLEYFRDGLQAGMVQMCGNAPAWIRDALLEQVAALLLRSSEATFSEEVKVFAENAKRYVDHGCGQDGKQLIGSLEAISSVLDATEILRY